MNTQSDHLRGLLRQSIQDGSSTVIGIADILSKSRQHVYDILTGKTTPSLSDAEIIANEIGCEIAVKTGLKKQKRKKRVN
jgi:predicted transcriptional regulator